MSGMTMNRRTALAGMAALLGVPALPALGAVPTERKFFKLEELELLTNIAGTIMPDTDTPGAVAAGVPAYFDEMMATWANSGTQAYYRNGLNAVGAALDKRGGKPFTSLDARGRQRVLDWYDSRAYSNGGDEARVYREIKQLIVSMYYASEIGATQELQFELVPGEWVSCAPLEEIGRTWAH